MHFLVFLVLPWKLHPGDALNCNFKGPLLSFLPRLSFRGMHDKSSLFSSCYLGRNGCQADYERLKITSKQKTISQIPRNWDNNCGPSSFSLLDYELSLLSVAGITLRSRAPFTCNNSKREIVCWL